MKSRVEALKQREKERKINRKKYYIFLLMIAMFISSIIVIDNKNRELIGDESIRIFSYSNNEHKLNILGNTYNLNYDFRKAYKEISDKLNYIIDIIKRELSSISSFLFVFHLYSFILKNSML